MDGPLSIVTEFCATAKALLEAFFLLNVIPVMMELSAVEGEVSAAEAGDVVAAAFVDFVGALDGRGLPSGLVLVAAPLRLVEGLPDGAGLWGGVDLSCLSDFDQESVVLPATMGVIYPQDSQNNSTSES